MNELNQAGFLNDYSISWGIYLFASLGILLGGWLISRNWPVLLRQLLRIISACIILTPVAVEQGQEPLAPAFIVALFSAAGGESEVAVRATTALVLSVGLALLAYGVWRVGRYFYLKKYAARGPLRHATNAGRNAKPAHLTPARLSTKPKLATKLNNPGPTENAPASPTATANSKTRSARLAPGQSKPA